MTDIQKPSWVNALESAEEILQMAKVAPNAESQNSLNEVARTWIMVAEAYTGARAVGRGF